MLAKNRKKHFRPHDSFLKMSQNLIFLRFLSKSANLPGGHSSSMWCAENKNPRQFLVFVCSLRYKQN